MARTTSGEKSNKASMKPMEKTKITARNLSQEKQQTGDNMIDVDKKNEDSMEAKNSQKSNVSSQKSASSSQSSTVENDLELLLMENKHLDKEKVLKLWQNTTAMRSSKFYCSEMKGFEILDLFVYLKESYASELVSYFQLNIENVLFLNIFFRLKWTLTMHILANRIQYTLNGIALKPVCLK